MVKGGSRLGTSSGQRGEMARSGECSNWTLRVVDSSGEALGSLDTCHHLDEGQILTTTMPIRQRKGSENGVHM